MNKPVSQIEPHVAIIIINWENWIDTKECLDSLLENNYPNYSVFLVDNFSKDGSYEKIIEYSRGKENIRVIRQESNSGFAGGVNSGCKVAIEEKTDYILLLNNDTTVEPDFLSNLMGEAIQDSALSIYSGYISSEDRKRFWYKGGKISWTRGGGAHIGRGTLFTEDAKTTPFETGFISGCMMLISKDILIKTGYLDESYFLYNEDAEFCLRAKNLGISLKVVPRSIIYHKERSTVGGWKPYHIYYLIRNKLIFMNRLAPDNIKKWRFYMIVFLAGLAYSLKWTVSGQPKLSSSYIKAVRDFIRGRDGRASYF